MLANTGAKLETWSWAWPCSAPRDLLKQFYINFVLIAGHKFYDITRIIFSREPFVSPGNLQTDPLTRNLLDILSSPLSESFRSQSNGRKWCLKWLCVNMKIAWCGCNGWDGCFCSPLSFNFLLPSDPVGISSSSNHNHKQIKSYSNSSLTF